MLRIERGIYFFTTVGIMFASQWWIDYRLGLASRRTEQIVETYERSFQLREDLGPILTRCERTNKDLAQKLWALRPNDSKLIAQLKKLIKERNEEFGIGGSN